MSKYFSQASTVSPLKHSLMQEWGALAHTIEMIYVEQGVGKLEILREFESRGDPVGHPATKLATLFHNSKYRPSVWTMRLSWETKHMCAVFAPNGFDIKSFRHDLAMLVMLGTLGKLCNRSNYLNGWEIPAQLVSGNSRWGNAQGWFHESSGVIVICFSVEQSHSLFEEILHILKIRPKAIRELADDDGLVDRVFKKAAEILLEEVAGTPRG